jgi:hypothetical protein
LLPVREGDIHCVRDAVIRGDRSIINKLEKATKISNDNMKKMVEWSTEAKKNTIILAGRCQGMKKRRKHIEQSTAKQLMNGVNGSKPWIFHVFST